MTQSKVIAILANINIILFATAVLPAAALNMPPKNPYLASSSSAMAHNDSAQQDAVAHAGPSGPSRTLSPDEIQYNHLGPAHFGSVVSGQYADGHRVLWGNGLDRIVKIDHDSYKVLDEYLLPGVEVSGPELAEQSVVVAGYGALVVNNGPRNIPWYLPRQATPLLISLLGSNPAYQPYGAQKFSWNPELREFQNTWVNRDVSSPSSVPIVSVGSNKLYLIGARKNQWTLEALDWTSGESVFHYVIGDQRYNPLFTLTSLDEAGRIHYGTPWGRVRLVPQQKSKR